MQMMIDASWWFERFLLIPYVPFVCAYAMAMAMPGWRSLAAVAGLALVAAAYLLHSWWSNTLFTLNWSVHDVYAFDRALFPLAVGLVGGVLLRAFQLRHGRPRLGWMSVCFFLLGLIARTDPLIAPVV